MKKQKYLTYACLVLPMTAGLFVTFNAMAATVDAATLAQLQDLIKQQQAQMDVQAKAIRELSAQIAAIEEQPATASPTIFTKSGNKTADVKLYGQVNRAILYAKDGNDDGAYHVDNEASGTRFGLTGVVNVSEDVSLGAKFEASLVSSGTYSVNQMGETTGNGGAFSARHMDLYIDSKKYGKFSLGQGDTASNGTSEVTFSDTWLVSNVNVADLAGGIRFYDKDTNSLDITGTNIGSVYSAMDGLSRRDRVRYDTPGFSGFKLSVSAMEEDARDIALTYSGEFSDIQVAAAIAYADWRGLSKDTDHQTSGSLAFLHESGFNVTFASGSQDMKPSANHDDPSFVYLNLGYKKKLSSIGQTAFSIDYGNYEDIAQSGDDASAYGLQIVQNIDDWGTEFYLGYRNHDLDRPGDNFADIDAFLAGARFRF